MTKALSKLSRFVKNRMLAYPSTCQTRTHVLLHAYLVGGNGVRWSSGMLFDSEDRERRKIVRDDRSINHIIETLKGMRERLRTQLPDDDVHDWYQSSLAQAMSAHAKREADLDYMERNIRALASTPDPTVVLKYGATNSQMAMEPFSRENPVFYGGHYEEPAIILQNLTGMFPSTLGKMPIRVEQSFFDGAIEVIDIVIRSVPDGSDKEALIDHRATLFAIHERY